MPLPTTINDLSKTAGSNFPQGTDSPSGLDDTQRAHASFIAQVRDGDHVAAATAKTTLVDADFFPMNDSAASNILKKITWANIKAALAGLYQPVGSYAASGANSDITSLAGLTTPLSAAQGGTGSTGGAVLLTGAQTIAGVKTFSSQPVLPQAMTLMTAQNTTSGTSIDFTGIPSWARRITVLFNGVSTNGSSAVQVQIGAGSVTTSGYSSSSLYWNSQINSTTGFLVGGVGATDARFGQVILTHMGGNVWNALSGTSVGTNFFSAGGGIAIGGSLDRIRLTTVNGTDTFDAGSVNVMYEG